MARPNTTEVRGAACAKVKTGAASAAGAAGAAAAAKVKKTGPSAEVNRTGLGAKAKTGAARAAAAAGAALGVNSKYLRRGSPKTEPSDFLVDSSLDQNFSYTMAAQPLQ